MDPGNGHNLFIDSCIICFLKSGCDYVWKLISLFLSPANDYGNKTKNKTSDNKLHERNFECKQLFINSISFHYSISSL